TPSSGSLLRLEGRVASLTQRELGAADPGVEPAGRRGDVGLPAAPTGGEGVHYGIHPARAAPHLPGVVGAEAEVADVGRAGPDDLRGAVAAPVAADRDPLGVVVGVDLAAAVERHDLAHRDPAPARRAVEALLDPVDHDRVLDRDVTAAVPQRANLRGDPVTAF